MNRFIFDLLVRKELPYPEKRLNFLRRSIYSSAWSSTPDLTPIDIVIPSIESDLDVLHFSVSSVRQLLLHPVQQIYIVSPDRISLRKFCDEHSCQWVNENSVLPIKLEDIGEYYCNNRDRRGWLFQQLLKLGADRFVEAENYYVLDCDTVLTSPQAIVRNSKFVLNTSDEFHYPYRVIYEKLLGEKPISPISFVSHQMLFTKKILAHLKNRIREHTGLPWYKAIVDLTDRSENSNFSEYELYGNFMCKYYCHKIYLEYFFNFPISRNNLKIESILEKQEEKKYKSISFHWHTNE
jgi:hypothetical protein